MELCKMYGKILGGDPENVFFFLQFSQNIDGLIQNNAQGFLEFIKLYKQNPLEKFLFLLFSKTIHWL